MTIPPPEKSPLSPKESSRFYTSIRGVILALVVLIGNGIHPIINNIRPESLDALNFVFQMSLWEMVFAIIFLAVKFFINKPKPMQLSNSIPTEMHHQRTFRKRNLFRLVIIGLLFSGATYLYISGLSEAGAIVGSIALKVSPIYAMLLGVLFLGEKVSWKQIGLTVCMLFGLYYLGTAGTFVFGSFSLGFAKLLIVPLFWAIGHALTKPLLENNSISPLQVILVRSSIVSLVIGGLTAILYDFSFLLDALQRPENLGFSFLMGGTYFFMHISWYNSITYIDLGYASALVTPSPALTTILAVSLGLEFFHRYDLIGMVVMFLGLFGLIWMKNKEMRSQKS